MGYIMCSGQQIEVPDLQCETWRYKPKLAFPRLKMRQETRAVVCHWTGGSGDHEQVFRTLVQRGLSVHFVIDPSGFVMQHCDAITRAAHCAGANPFSIGIEIVNPATVTSTEKPPRAIVRDEIHGVDVIHTEFYPAQMDAAIKLTRALCDYYKLPFDVPRDTDGDVFSTVLPPERLATYRGVMGHLHVSDQKNDCGLTLLRAIAAQQHRGTNRPAGHAE